MNRYILVSFLLIFSSSCKHELVKDAEEIKTDNSVFTIAFGSCHNQDSEDQEIWEVIAGHQPDLWIWLGDIIYADTEDMQEMKADYELLQKSSEYQRISTTTNVLGVWDDHDYGANNSGKDYPMKDSSKALMLSFLGVPSSHDVWSRPGVYQSYDYELGKHKIKVILLDVRYFRDEPGPENTIIGAEQWAWMEEELRSSDADMHIIGGGSQFLPEDHRFEKWANYPKDRARLISLLDQYDVDQPVLLSGDRHLGEMSVVKDQDDQPILEVTSSGLTHSYRGFTSEENRHRVKDVVVPLKNFGLLQLHTENDQLSYTASLYDEYNKLQVKVSNQELSSILQEQ